MGCAQSKLPAASEVLEECQETCAAPVEVDIQRSGAKKRLQEETGAVPACKPLRPAHPVTRSFFNEADRLQELRCCGVLNRIDSWPENEKRFDDITKLMATIFQVPVSLVSLVDDAQNHFKSVAGPFGCGATREGSFCDAIFIPPRHEVLIVENAPQDARFSANPFVTGPPGICFYAGAPLVGSNGHRLGSLCVIDLKPRKFSAGLLNTLTNFAELVVRELERDKVLPMLEQQEEQQDSEECESPQQAAPGALLRQARNFAEGVALVDVTQPGWPIVYANDAWTALIGGVGQATDGEPAGPSLWELLEPSAHLSSCSSGRAPAAAERAVQSGAPTRLEVVHAGTMQRHKIMLRPAATDQIQTNVLVGIPNFVLNAARRGSSDSNNSDTSPSGRNSTDFWFVVVSGSGDSGGSNMGSDTPLPSKDLLAASSVGAGGTLGSSTLGSKATSLRTGGSQAGRLTTQGQVVPAAFKDIQLGPLLGSGGYGRVYRAELRGALVAIKVIESSQELLDAQGKPMGALYEAVLSKDLRHPNIVQTYEYAARKIKVRSHNAKPAMMQEVWIAQQYCNRGTLYDAIDRGWLRRERSLTGAPNATAILQTACEIASAITYLHSKNILHADLSGRNVLLNAAAKDGRRFTALVCDFGLSRALSAANHKVASYAYGTISHQPPELLAEGLLSKAVDVFSFGVLLWEMWGGCRAWAGRPASEIILKVTSGEVRLELPAESTLPAYKALCDTCLSFDPARRPTIDSVLQQLLAMLETAE